MRITFLGTGGVYPTKTRALPAIAVRVEDELVLFDCGEGTLRQFIQSQESFMKVSRLFITHHHADHVLGIPGLMQTMTLNDRKEPLYFYGPKGTERLVEVLSSFGNAIPFEIHAKDLEPGDVVACRRFLVHTAMGNTPLAIWHMLSSSQRDPVGSTPRSPRSSGSLRDRCSGCSRRGRRYR